MKKNKLLLILLLSINSAFCQINLGGHLSFHKPLGLKGTPGLGVKLDLNSSKKLDFTFELDYYLPLKEVRSATAYNENFGSDIIIAVENKITFFNIQIFGKYYFKKDLNDSFDIYGLAGLGIWLVPIFDRVIGEYDQTIYTINTPKDYSENLFGVSSNFRLGLEKNLGLGEIYLESGINIKLKSIGGDYFHQSLSSSGAFNLGYRFHF